jgi:hypothetical protein
VRTGYVKSEGCHLLFYGMVGEEADCCVCTGWFSVYVHLRVFVFARYCQIKKVNRSLLFIRRVEFNGAVYIVCICFDCVWIDSCCIVYD